MHKLQLGCLVLALAATASVPLEAQVRREQVLAGKPGPVLKRFASARAFAAYLKRAREHGGGGYVPAPPPLPPPAIAVPQVPAPAPTLAAPQASATSDAIVAQDMGALPDRSVSEALERVPGVAITNNQSVGVDEGGIVKQVGRFLIVLQDGRLFSIDLGSDGRSLRLADRADVYRSAETAADWYDEMLVFEDRVLVTAYNYEEKASEITVLRIDSAGRLRREGRYLMSSDDYYSTENYASRLVGDSLVFYAPYDLLDYDEADRFAWPMLRRAEGDGPAGEGIPLLGPTDVYAPVGVIDSPVLHTLAVCPLRAGIECRTTAFVGPPVRELYVSPTDAYLWIGEPDGLPWSIEYGNRRRFQCPQGQYWIDPVDSSALLYKLPLDGGPAGAVAVDGIPDDQFAFEARGGRLRVLVKKAQPACLGGDEHYPLALLDIPVTAFGPRLRQVSQRAYTRLPPIENGQLEKRFVGDWLIYGGRDGRDMPDDATAPRGSVLFAVPLARPRDTRRLGLAHNAVRIERLGNDALVTGYRDTRGLWLTYVSLGRTPAITSTALLPNRFESENRSHAFGASVRADGSGILGLPTTLRIRRADRGWSDSEASDLSFVTIAPGRKLAPAGELSTAGEPAKGYECEVSCVDWYGNSRPIFTGGRIFALMGTELVEGELRAGRIGEKGRVDLTGEVE